MKKPKISLDADKLKLLALNHIEKVILGIVVLLMLMLVYRGMTLEKLKGGITPQKLVETSNQRKAEMDDPQRWTQVAPERTPAYNIVKQVKEIALAKTDALAYSLSTSWMRPD